MSDLELLELAAKAAGYQVEWVRNSGCYYRCEEEIGREQWNPLEDDGDALRLAVAIKEFPQVMVMGKFVGFDGMDIAEDFTADPSGATRRAIVRAAAEIEKNR